MSQKKVKVRIVESHRREWHGTHQSWSFHPQAFRWTGEMICGINLLPIATEVRAWMLGRGQLPLMPTPSSCGFTNPYTSSGVTLLLLMSRVINRSYEYANTVDPTHDEIDSEIERILLYNEIVLYSARLCEVTIKQILYCTQIPKSKYKGMALGQLLESPCPTCKKENSKKPHSISLISTLAHPYYLCLEFEQCAMNHMDLVNKLRKSEAAP